jgi:hypothetical protein
MAEFPTKECRICHEISDEDKMISPCECSGSIKYVHEECIQKWINIKRSNICETCKSTFNDSVNCKEIFDEIQDENYLEEEYERIVRENRIRLNNIRLKNFNKYLCQNGIWHFYYFYFFVFFHSMGVLYYIFVLSSIDKLNYDDIYGVKVKSISVMILFVIYLAMEYYDFNSWRIQTEQNQLLQNFNNARHRN